MELRNLRRIFQMRRSFEMYNKKHEHLTPKQWTVLIGAYFFTQMKKKITSSFYKYLCRNKITLGSPDFCSRLKELKEGGYITKVTVPGKVLQVISVTEKGKEALSNLEHISRHSRVDK